MKKVIKFRDWECKLSRSEFGNKVACIVLSDVNDEQPVAKASVNLPCYRIGKNQTFIKDVRENEGILKELIDNGIVALPEELLYDDEGTLVDIIEPSLMI